MQTPSREDGQKYTNKAGHDDAVLRNYTYLEIKLASNVSTWNNLKI